LAQDRIIWWLDSCV